MADKNELLAKLDKETGYMYCGGEETYGIILAECVMSYKDTATELEEALAKEDFNLYVIKIHGLKSTMKSIGAMELSEKARVLEFAGKDGDYDSIRNGHREVLDDYREMMEAISTSDMAVDYLEEGFVFEPVTGEGSKAEAVNVSATNQISAEQLATIKAEFENAMYGLDEDTMTKLVNQLKDSQYSEIAAKMAHKISMSDYFSAGDLLATI